MVFASDSKSSKKGAGRGLNVGLNVRNPRSMEQVIGYSRCLPPALGVGEYNGAGAPRWQFSYRVVELILEYRARFPALYTYLIENSGQTTAWRENIYAEDLVAYVKRFATAEQQPPQPKPNGKKQKSSTKSNKQHANSTGASNGMQPSSRTISSSSSPSDFDEEGILFCTFFHSY